MHIRNEYCESVVMAVRLRIAFLWNERIKHVTCVCVCVPMIDSELISVRFMISALCTCVVPVCARVRSPICAAEANKSTIANCYMCKTLLIISA